MMSPLDQVPFLQPEDPLIVDELLGVHPLGEDEPLLDISKKRLRMI